MVRAGEWDSQSTSEPLRHEDKRVVRVITYPNFNPGNLWYDIAVILVESPYELQLHIDTICLPPKGFSFDGMRCVVSGWGKDGYGSTSKFLVLSEGTNAPYGLPFLGCCNDERR